MEVDLTQTHDVLGTYHSIDFSDIRKKYQDEGTKYAFKVLDEEIETGYLIKLACKGRIQRNFLIVIQSNKLKNYCCLLQCVRT